MPKTFNNLWPKIVSFDNLFEAFHTSRKGHRYQKEVLDFMHNLEENLIDLQNHLIWHTWRPDPPRKFIIYEPKKRIIAAPSFRDRIIHQAVMRIVEPLFEQKYITHSYACLQGRGCLAAALKAQQYIRSYPRQTPVYVMKGDVKSYFPSVHHGYLKKQIMRTVRDPNVLWLLFRIIDEFPDGRGMGIGSLTSQVFANVNLNPFDHWIKDDLGIKRYVRYMDDFVIISDNKQHLKKMLSSCTDYLSHIPSLTINPKSDVIPMTHGLNFCGYRIFRDYLLPRKRNIKNARKRLRKLADLYQSGDISLYTYYASLASFLGYAKHCRSYRSVESVLDTATITSAPGP